MANQKETGAHPVFVPSSWKLEQMIAAAMAKCDGDIEQAHLAKEARAEARMVRAIEAEVAARRRVRLYGI